LNKILAKPELTDEEWGSVFTTDEWMTFFKTNLLPLDKLSEERMIGLFKDDRPELNRLLILHNTKASDNLAEVYFKRYQKNCPTQWHDLDDFKQMALEGLSIAAERFKPSSGNKFITYATWWMLNKVRRPYQEKNAMVGHTSMSSLVAPQDPGNTMTFEESLTDDMLANGYSIPGMDETLTNPLSAIDKKSLDEKQILYSGLKETSIAGQMPKEKFAKTKEMVDYLMSIVEKNENSYGKKQIFLYLFKKVFNKFSSMCQDNTQATKLNSYVNEAAKSKAELLKRLNMSEKQYEATCKRLTRGKYDGII